MEEGRTGPIGDLVRFQGIALGLSRALKRFETVLEVAIVGSVAGRDPYPFDLDLAICLSDTSDIEDVAACARRAGIEHPAWDIFLFDRDIGHLGRLCHFNECPRGKDECQEKGCGRPAYVHKIAGFEFDEARFFSSPIDVLLSPRGPSLFQIRQRALGITEPRIYRPAEPVWVRCRVCGEDFELDGGSRKYFDRLKRRYPDVCEDCMEERGSWSE